MNSVEKIERVAYIVKEMAEHLKVDTHQLLYEQSLSGEPELYDTSMSDLRKIQKELRRISGDLNKISSRISWIQGVK